MWMWSKERSEFRVPGSEFWALVEGGGHPRRFYLAAGSSLLAFELHNDLPIFNPERLQPRQERISFR
jgi:hypothetical protein